MAEHERRPLRVITTPRIGHVLIAPPTLMASTPGIGYTCGRCGSVLLKAEDGQVHGLLIRCSNCGSNNTTE